MTEDEIALQIFLALIPGSQGKISLYPNLGEQQIRTCFELARVFKMVSADVSKATK